MGKNILLYFSNIQTISDSVFQYQRIAFLMIKTRLFDAYVYS